MVEGRKEDWRWFTNEENEEKRHTVAENTVSHLMSILMVVDGETDECIKDWLHLINVSYPPIAFDLSSKICGNVPVRSPSYNLDTSAQPCPHSRRRPQNHCP